MGVWIEIVKSKAKTSFFCVTPCVGVWIEIMRRARLAADYLVTPCVGVWIEMIVVIWSTPE